MRLTMTDDLDFCTSYIISCVHYISTFISSLFYFGHKQMFRTCPCRQTYLLIHALERGFKSSTFSFFLSVYLFLPILKLPFGSWNDDGMNDSRNHSQSSVCRVMLTSLVQLTSNFFLTSSSSFGLCSEPVRSYVALELEFNHWEAKKTRHTTRVTSNLHTYFVVVVFDGQG